MSIARCGAVERGLGAPLRRTRDGDAGGRAVRQAFFRLGEVILEVVGPPVNDGPVTVEASGPARFWGLAVTVAAIDELYERLGPELVSPPKGAVQSGRRIATVRSAAGLSVPLAFMSAGARP